MPGATPLYPKSMAKPTSLALELKALAQHAPAHPSRSALAGLFRRMFRRDEPSVFHRCLAIHMHNAARPSALSPIRW